jgi:hypothetical protein
MRPVEAPGYVEITSHFSFDLPIIGPTLIARLAQWQSITFTR